MAVRWLDFGGALTTQWSPPSSCLFTTSLFSTGYGANYFMGYNSYLGTDRGCFPGTPKPTPTSPPPEISSSYVAGVGTSTIGTSLMAYPTIVSTIVYTRTSYMTPEGRATTSAAYFSPGICPSGYNYAASYTGAATLRADKPPSQNGTESRYMCCPNGYTVKSIMATREPALTEYTYSGASKAPESTVASTAYYNYPLCIREASTFSNVLEVGYSWPITKPTSVELADVTVTSRYPTSILRATASGIVVGWQSSDSVVTNFIRDNNIILPTIFTTRPTSTPGSDSNGEHGKIDGAKLGGGIFAAVFAVAMLIWIMYCRKMRKKKKFGASSPPSQFVGIPRPHPPATRRNNTPRDIEMMANPRTASRMSMTDEERVLEPPPPRYEEAIASNNKP